MKTNITEIIDGIEINLELRHDITVVCGDSGTGKTYLSDLLTSSKNPNIICLSYKKDRSRGYIDLIINKMNSSGSIFIIDQADDLFYEYPELRKCINGQIDKNYFVVMGRNTGLHYSVDCAAEIEVNNNKIRLKYLLD